ncbi:LLM class oxidoreductase [Paenibacillus donghaensis]|uniref:LLM class flavin-dependent oxidoreductase n=1 Tax=Paenibacillus donghaensis TaxID=414771 RepID=A0A2Z2KNG1_9BACL|nr:LLM class oxidoreductase [Paenibacillus donghaensis]ASA21641.1 LLM class flavin-dependent oxidoreductase [Paenibacillus donghaensis]
MEKFRSHNGFARSFKENKLTIGLQIPIENYSEMPKMDLEEQMRLAKKAEEMEFASLWVRDSPLRDPSFGDAGLIYDPWIFLGYLTAHTQRIALGTSSIVTTYRHPLHLAKSAASMDKMSQERFLFGVATGDRPIEFPAFKVNREERAALFRETIDVVKKVWREPFPKIQTIRVDMNYGDIIPKPTLSDIPVFGTGFSGQSIEWLARNTDGWLFYPQIPDRQRELIKQWRLTAGEFKPFIQPFGIVLSEDPNEVPLALSPSGFKTGYKFLIEYFYSLQEAGINHVPLALKFGYRPVEEVIQEIGEFVVPHFKCTHEE